MTMIPFSYFEDEDDDEDDYDSPLPWLGFV
jgi:hypothetical protein